MADPPAMEDQAEGEVRPILPWDLASNVLFDLDRVSARGEAKAITEAVDMGVHGEAGQPKSDAEHHVGCLATDSGQVGEADHAGGHLAPEALGQSHRRAHDRPGLLAKKSGGLDESLHLGGVRRRQVSGLGPAVEEQWSDPIHSPISRLGAEDGGQQELVGRGEVELTFRLVDLLQAGDRQAGA